MRSFLLTSLSACLALVLPCAAWAQGAVYAMTNAIHNNQVVVWSRAADGTLSATPVQTIGTNGGGSGIQFGGADADDTLGSQGSIAIDPAHRLLFAVNTENTAENLILSSMQDCNALGSITSFLINPDGTLSPPVTKVSSGGLFPDSLALQGSQLYVLNAGGGAASGCGADADKNPNVTGFHISPTGAITAIPGATQPIDPGPDGAAGFLNCDPTLPVPCGLSPPLFVRSPGQVGFTPDGKSLIVTVKGTNSIYVFPVNPKGTTGLGSPTVFQATGTRSVDPEPTYFGFTFDPRGHLIVTEPFGGAPITSIPTGGASAVSSFTVGKNGVLTPISSHVADGATASCWVALDPRTKSYAYTTNNVSGNISSFSLGSDGTLTLLESVAASLTGPNDMATAKDRGGSFLYVNASGAGKVYAYQINSDGTLTLIDSYSGLPTAEATGQGLAAY
jgi:6-phosphogluconolactonase (cycloisomerase 2 family)